MYIKARNNNAYINHYGFWIIISPSKLRATAEWSKRIIRLVVLMNFYRNNNIWPTTFGEYHWKNRKRSMKYHIPHRRGPTNDVPYQTRRFERITFVDFNEQTRSHRFLPSCFEINRREKYTRQWKSTSRTSHRTFSKSSFPSTQT